jgi:ribosome-associated protein
MEVFKLKDGEFIELNNLLKALGLCDSGGIANTMIAQGFVKIDGKIELRKRCKIRAVQIIDFEDHKVLVKK